MNTRTFKVVMLPTEKASIISLIPHNKLETTLTGKPISSGNNHHLYIISNDEIKGGDWCINRNLDTIYKIDSRDSLSHIHLRWNKIVCSTDKSMTPNCWIPDSFVQAYIKAYNEGKEITEVDLEMETFYEPIHDGMGHLKNHKIKTRPDNTVIIHQSKTYTSQEVMELIKKAHNNGYWLCYDQMQGEGFSGESPISLNDLLKQLL